MSGYSFQFFYLIDLFLKNIYHRIFQFATHRPGGGNRLRCERARLSQPGAQLRPVGQTVGERPVCRGAAQYRALRDRLVESAGPPGGRLTGKRILKIRFLLHPNMKFALKAPFLA
jgi:hypothetical protein